MHTSATQQPRAEPSEATNQNKPDLPILSSQMLVTVTTTRKDGHSKGVFVREMPRNQNTVHDQLVHSLTGSGGKSLCSSYTLEASLFHLRKQSLLSHLNYDKVYSFFASSQLSRTHLPTVNTEGGFH